jgi:hypothetical protein
MKVAQHENLDVALAVNPAALTDDPTANAVDLLGYDAATILIPVGVGGITFTSSNKVEFKVTHCDTSDGDFAAVEQADIKGATVTTGGIVRSLVAAHAAASCAKIAYVGGKRYIKVLPDFGGTHNTATPMTVLVIKGLPKAGPVAYTPLA